jgi:putative transposase
VLVDVTTGKEVASSVCPYRNGVIDETLPHVSGELRRFLEGRQNENTRGAPTHPMTQGKIEGYHRSMKNLVQLQTFSSPWDLEQEISRFADYHNHQRYHESLDNVTPTYVCFGRAKEVQSRREEIKRRPLEGRHQQHVETLKAAAHRPGRLALACTPEGCVGSHRPDPAPAVLGRCVLREGLRPRAASPEGANGVSSG